MSIKYYTRQNLLNILNVCVVLYCFVSVFIFSKSNGSSRCCLSSLHNISNSLRIIINVKRAMYISMKVGSSGEGFDFLHKGANQKGKKEVTSKAVG